MTVKYKVFENPNFVRAFTKLQGYTPKPFAKIRLAKFIRCILEHAELFNEAKEELVNKYVKMDEEGNPLKVTIGNKIKFDFSDEEGWKKEIKELHEKDIDAPELRYSWLSEKQENKIKCTHCSKEITTNINVFEASAIEGLLDFLTDDVNEKD